MSTFLSNTDRFNSLITDVPVTESPAEAADHRGWMAEYRAHMVRKQTQATEDPEQRIKYAMEISHYQVEAALHYAYADRRRAWMAEERARTAKDPLQAAKERARAAEYRAQSTNWVLQSIKKRVCKDPIQAAEEQARITEYRAQSTDEVIEYIKKEICTVQDDEAKNREIAVSCCSFHLTRYRNLAAEEWARAAKDPDRAAAEYAQIAEKYVQAIDNSSLLFGKDYIEVFGVEYVDVLGEYMSESHAYQADAAEYRAQMITKFDQVMKILNSDGFNPLANLLDNSPANSLATKRKALADNCHALVAVEQNLAAEHRIGAVEVRTITIGYKAQAIAMLLQATQNPARAVEYQVWLVECLTYVVKYSAKSIPAQAAKWEALRDMLRLMEILQGFQELITAKKASIVGQLDSFQIICPLLAFLQSNVRKALREALEEIGW
jgi:hypothetical protein